MSDLTEAQILEVEESATHGNIASESSYGEDVRALIAEVRRLRSSVPGATPPDADVLATCQRWTAQIEHLKTGILALADDWDLKASMEETRRPGDLTVPNVLRKRARQLRETWDRLALTAPPSPGTTETGTRGEAADARAPRLDSLKSLLQDIEWDAASLWDATNDARALGIHAVAHNALTLFESHECAAVAPAPRVSVSVPRLASPSPGSEGPRGADRCAKCGSDSHMTIETLPPEEVCQFCGAPWPGDNHAEKEE